MKRGFIFTFLFLIAALLSAQERNLDFYLEKALQNSPQLKEYQGLIMTNRLDSMRVRSEIGIQVKAVSNNYYAPVINGWGFDKAVTDGANLSAMVSISKELTGKQNLQNRFDALNIQNQSLKNSGKISEQEIKKNIIEQYLAAFGSWQQYHFIAEVLSFYSNGETILKEMTEKGVYKQTDYLSFLVNLQQQNMRLLQLKNQYQTDLATLNYQCGIEDTTLIALPDPELTVESIPKFRNSVFFSRFTLDSLKLRNDIRQVDFSYKPKISLTGDGGYLSSLAYMPYKNFGVNAGISLSVPIYDGGQRKLHYDRIAIEELNRKNYQDYFGSQYHQQINMLFQQLNATRDLRTQIFKQISYSKALVVADQMLLQTGDIRITDYMMAINIYLDANNMLAENTLSYYRIINQINFWNREN